MLPEIVNSQRQLEAAALLAEEGRFDSEAIAGITGQPHRWVVERGTAD